MAHNHNYQALALDIKDILRAVLFFFNLSYLRYYTFQGHSSNVMIKILPQAIQPLTRLLPSCVTQPIHFNPLRSHNIVPLIRLCKLPILSNHVALTIDQYHNNPSLFLPFPDVHPVALSQLCCCMPEDIPCNILGCLSPPRAHILITNHINFPSGRDVV